MAPHAPVLRFGLQIPSFSYRDVPDDKLFEHVASLATAAERSGFDSLFVMDHFYQIRNVGQREEPMLEAYTLLGAIASRTSRVQLGTMVTGVTYRNPALLAKIVTTLDVISAGRALLGIGAAWNDEEHAGYGFEFPPAPERFDRLEEALQICRAMFEDERPSFEGVHYRIDHALDFPRPIRGRIPILVGGSGERRTLRLVARYADACNLFGDPATIRHKLEVLERHCEEIGRDPAEITKTALGSLVIAPDEATAGEQVRALAAACRTSEEQVRSAVVAGAPASVVEQVTERIDAGLDGIVFNLPASPEPETIELAGSTLAALVA